MMAIFIKELRSRKWFILGFCLIGFGLTLLYVSLFPSIQSQAASFDKILEILPKGYLTAFGVQGSGFESLENFLSLELFSLIWPLLLIIYMLSWGGNAIAGEIERGTIGTLLSLPVSRTQVYFAKFYAGLAALVTFITCSLLSAMPLAKLFGLDFSLRNFIATAILCFLFGALLLGMSLLVSALVNERSKVYFSVGGVLLIMYSLNIVAGIKTNLSGLANVSVFHYFDAPEALRTSVLDQKSCLLLMIVGLAAVLAGAYRFRRRDISV